MIGGRGGRAVISAEGLFYLESSVAISYVARQCAISSVSEIRSAF